MIKKSTRGRKRKIACKGTSRSREVMKLRGQVKGLAERIQELEADVADLEERNSRLARENAGHEQGEEHMMFVNRVLSELIQGAMRGEIPKDTIPEGAERPTKKDLSVENSLLQIVFDNIRKPLS